MQKITDAQKKHRQLIIAEIGKENYSTFEASHTMINAIVTSESGKPNSQLTLVPSSSKLVLQSPSTQELN